MSEDKHQFRLKSFEIEAGLEYMKWDKEIPYINFPKDWYVKIRPSFGGAIVRFEVKKGNKTISVYLDCYDFLGTFGEPYWEMYPHKEDTYRCPMNNVEELIKHLKEELEAEDENAK